MRIKTIIWIIVGLIFTSFLCFAPVKGNYTVKWENDKNGMMGITYSSIIPFVKVDTIVPLSKPFIAEIITHEKFVDNGIIRYNTIVRVGKEIYKYTNRDAYEYVRQFKDSTGHYKLEEVFFPIHHIRTYHYYIGEEN